MPQTYHTIIIGSGVAGINAARHLKSKTLVLDKKAEIGLPVQCGEGVSLLALEREKIELQARWIVNRITHIKRIMPNRKFIGEQHNAPYAFVLNKGDFEKYLARLVPWEIKLHSRVVSVKKDNRLWVVKTDKDDQFYANHIIGADGPHSLVADQAFNIQHRIVPAINYAVNFKKPVQKNELHMYFGNQIAPSGYGWVFPLSDASANVGILIKHKGRIKDYFFRFLDTVLKPLYGEYELMENKSGVLPVSGFPECVTKNGAFLVGDAGSFTDPIFKGGINMALLTGRLAAESINKDIPANYQKSFNALPFSAKDLVDAQKRFYELDDTTLNELGDVIDGKSTSFLMTEEGQKMFQSKTSLVKHQSDIFSFAKIWQLAKPYIW